MTRSRAHRARPGEASDEPKKGSARVPAPRTPTEMTRRPSQILKHGAGAFFAGAAVGLAETSSKSMV